MVKTLRKYPILITIIGFLIGWCGLKYLPYEETLVNMILIRMALGIIMLGIMILMGAGKSFLKFKEGLGFTFRSSLYPLILALIVSIVSTLPVIRSGGIPAGLLMAELPYLVLSFWVGVFEEGLFRGVLLNGILRKTGKTRQGIWCAVLIASFLFGVFHVTSYIFGGSYDLTGVLQAIGKILETGVFAVLMSAIYIKTKNFWGIALVHMLNDFLAFQSDAFTNSAPARDYVNSGARGIAMVIGYVILLLLYIPMLYKAIKIIKGVEIPEYGVYKEE